MDLIRDMRPFGKGLHQLSVVSTDLTEAEALIKVLADKEKNRVPHTFAGKGSCVYFKLPYIPPCDPFKELRRLILRIRENTGLRANFHGVIAIEVSEWIGHEHEEYFTVLLKYLYDHRTFWRIATVLNGCTPNQINRYLSCCSKYITPHLFTINVFGDHDTLCSLIHNEFTQQNRRITQEAADLLATALTRQELKDARSLTLIERTAEEVSYICEYNQVATIDTIREYLLDPYSTLTMMAGMPLFDERSVVLEKEALQLRG